MFRALITVIFIFLVFGIIGITIWYESEDESLGNLHLKKKIVEPGIMTIREIDDISALTNYHFTIQNKIIRKSI